ncbi:hypothetical protein OK016_26560 [Vibrio chagasii]|nr:hypothetical protein [Vibrio chagasii]
MDGGNYQKLPKEDLLDEPIIWITPVVLGGGAPLFGDFSFASPLYAEKCHHLP